MAVQLSIAVRNARLDAIETTISTAPIMTIRTGAAPADCATANSGTVLATLTLPSDWLAAAAAGSKALSGSWTDASADNTGTAAHFRIHDSTATTWLASQRPRAPWKAPPIAAGAQDYLVKGRVDGDLLTRSVRYAVERKRAENNAAALQASEQRSRENARLDRALVAQEHIIAHRQSLRWWFALPWLRVRMWMRRRNS